MRRVTPQDFNTNERDYYLDVRPVQYQPYNYLVAFRPVSGYQQEAGFYGWFHTPTYYVGLLTTPQKLVEAVTIVNDLFCADELRTGNSDSRPEPMVPIPLDEQDTRVVWYFKDNVKDMWEYVTDEFTRFPTDGSLTPTRWDAILDRVGRNGAAHALGIGTFSSDIAKEYLREQTRVS